MRSFFTEPENITADKIVLTEDVSHIRNVLRMECGDEILVFDGTGREYKAEIISIEQKCVVCRKLEEGFSAAEPRLEVTLFQGIPKSDKMEQIIQKSAELGIFETVPVKMERCVAKLDKASEKLKRWNKISREAAKQCGRGRIPPVREPVSFKEAVKQLAEKDLAIMPYEILGHAGEKGLKEILSKAGDIKTIGILIGPEGGFSDGEAAYAAEFGINQVGLGRRILRTETAGSAILSVVMYENDEI